MFADIKHRLPNIFVERLDAIREAAVDKGSKSMAEAHDKQLDLCIAARNVSVNAVSPCLTHAGMLCPVIPCDDVVTVDDDLGPVCPQGQLGRFAMHWQHELRQAT